MKFVKKMRGRLRLRDSGSQVNNGGWLYSALRPNSVGVVIDEIMSLNLAAIWRAVNVKAGDLAKLPLNVYERLPNAGKRPDWASPIYELLTYPNYYRTGRKQRHAAAVHLILWGNSYQEILRNPETGDPERLELLDPRLVLPRRDDHGQLTYWLKGSMSPWSGKKTLLPENVVHFSGLSINGDHGLSTVQTTSEPIATATALDKYAGTLWGNGAIPNGVIECPPGWPDDARANFRQSWQDEHGGITQSNRTAILEEGAKWVATAFDPEKLQMVASREYSTVEICRIVGVPPHKLFDMSHDIQRSLEEMNKAYYDDELDPICQGMADEYSLKFFTVSERKQRFISFDMSGVMKGKALERAQTNDIKMRNGVITANEWRAEEGLNPFDQDVRLTPLNMVAIQDSQDTDPALDPDPEDEGPTDPEPLALVDQSREVLREALRRMTRREVLHIREAVKKNNFTTEWVTKFYDDFAPIFTESIAPALSLHAKARGLTLDASETVGMLLDGSKSALASCEAVGAVLDDWEAHKVDNTITTVEALP